MRTTLVILLLINHLLTYAQYAPPVGQTGSTAIFKDSSIIKGWATAVFDFKRGFLDIANPGLGKASYGDSTNALGLAEGNSSDVVSLGDQGSITLTFNQPIINGSGFDFVVFENSFSDDYLELAFVEVSTDGEHFVRFPSVSLTPENEIGSFGTIDATKIYNLAGKYRQGYGTPFDLEDLVDSTGIDLNQINYIKIIDVIGTTLSSFATYDSQGHIIIDPYDTPFASGGFDLDAIGVLNQTENASITEFSTSELKLTIFPNPSKGPIQINANQNGTIFIFNTKGELVNETVIETNKIITIPYLKPGLYIVQMLSKEGIETKKIIFQ